MGVSKNGGGPPKSSILIGFSIINHPFGYPYFWKHPYVDVADMVDMIEKIILKALYMKQTQADFHAKLDWFVHLEFILMGFQISVNTWNEVLGRHNEPKKSMTEKKKERLA